MTAMEVRRNAAALALGAILVTMISCSGAKMSDMWRDLSFTAGPMKNVLVVAVIKKDSGRRLWEDAFGSELRKKEVQVTPSYSLFPSALPDTNEVVEAVRKQGFDGVIVVHRMKPDTTHAYVPGYVTNEPVTLYDDWFNAYRTYYTDVYHPGYVETDREVRSQIEAWSVTTHGHPVWTGMSVVDNPESSDEVRKKVAEATVKEMTKQGIIP